MSYVELLRRDLTDPVVSLFANPDISEIGRDPGHEEVWIDSQSKGALLQTGLTLPDGRVREFLGRVADAQGRVIQTESPRLEAALPQRIFGGARLAGTVPPVSPKGPGFVIRNPPGEPPPLESYVEDGIMTQGEYDALLKALLTEKNIFVIGAGGSGKTLLTMSLLEKLTESKPDAHIVTIEDTPELSLSAWCWYQLCTTPEIGYIDLIETAMRKRPDRIVIGESRGRSVLRLFDAMLSGHPGISTFHSETAERALRRIMIYCRRSSDTDSHAETIADAIDLMIVLQRTGSTRTVTEMVCPTLTPDGGFRLTPPSPQPHPAS